MELHEIVIFAEITSFQAGIATMSMPPQVHASMQLNIIKELRGHLDPKGPFKMIFIGDKAPVAQGQKALLYGTPQKDFGFVFQGAMPCESIEAAEKMVAENPVGWQNGAMPFKVPFTAMKDFSGKRCPRTQRPWIPMPKDVLLTIEKIIPADVNEHRNKWGNGDFKFTFVNKGAEAVVPLFQDVDSKKVLLQQSIVIVAERYKEIKQYIFPEKLPQNLQFYKMKAGETLEFTISVLPIVEFPWPQGGERVHLNFVIGGVSVQDYFYFNTSVHENMLKAAVDNF